MRHARMAGRTRTIIKFNAPPCLRGALSNAHGRLAQPHGYRGMPWRQQGMAGRTSAAAAAAAAAAACLVVCTATATARSMGGAGAAAGGVRAGFLAPHAAFWGLGQPQQQQQGSHASLAQRGGLERRQPWRGQQHRQGGAGAWGIPTALRASTMAPPAAAAASASSGSRKSKGVTIEEFAAQLEPFGVTGIRFCGDGEEDELAVCCPETRRLMDCTVDMYASINGTKYCVALPLFNPVAICYHKGERMIPVENDCELMDRLYDFLAPTLEQEDLFLIRSPVCLTLDGDLGDLGDDEEFTEEELEGWEEFESEDDPWEDGEDPLEGEDLDEARAKEEEEEAAAEEKDPMLQEIERMTNPKYWDDADAGDVQDAYGEDWEKIAAFSYDGVDYTMVKILEPVLVLAKEDPAFKGITKWVLPSEAEAEEVAPIMEGIIKVKLGIDDAEEEDDD